MIQISAIIGFSLIIIAFICLIFGSPYGFKWIKRGVWTAIIGMAVLVFSLIIHLFHW